MKLISLASIIVGTSVTTCAAANQRFLATFDGLAIPGAPAALTPVPVPYNLLNYSGFNAAQALPVAVAITGVNETDYAVSNNKSPGFSIHYAGSKVRSFDLNSIYAGFYVSLRQGAAAPPLDCTITFTGLKAGSGKMVTQAVNFRTGAALGIGLVSQQVQRYDISSAFQGMQSVAVTYQPRVLSAVTNGVAGVAIDNVGYVTHS